MVNDVPDVEECVKY